MATVMSVLHGNYSYYTIIDALHPFRIGEKPNDNLVIPHFETELLIVPSGKAFQIEISNKQGKRIVEAGCDVSTVIDYEKRIAVYIAESTRETISVQMPPDCEIHVGKSDKTSPDGSRNEIVLDFPFVSRNHFKIVRENGETIVIDNNSTNGLFLNGKKITSARVKSGDVISIFTIRLIVDGDGLRIENAGDHLKLYRIKDSKKRKEAPLRTVSRRDIQFTRAPRLVPNVENETISLERPPQIGGQPQINWLNVLVTPFISVALMVVLVLVMGISAVMLIMSGVMSVASAIVAVINYRNQKKQHGETDEKINEKYHAYLSSVAQRIEIAHNYQLQSMVAANPAPTECAIIAENREHQLWERRPSDSDFLVARLGTGTVAASVTASFQQQQVIIEENALETEAYTLAQNSKSIAGAPILCSLIAGKQNGVIGNREDELLLVRNIITELTTLHAYDELKIVAIVSEQEKEKWSWLRWLPHCMDNQREKHYIFTSMDEAEGALGEVEETLSRRKAELTDYHRSDSTAAIPHYLFIIAEFPWIEKCPIRKYIFSDSEIGCSSLFIYNKLNSLPKECSQIIEVDNGKGVFYNRTSISNKVQFQIDQFELKAAEEFARSMAPIFTETEQAAASMPTNVSFLEGYCVNTPEQLDIAGRWKRAKPYQSLSVPIAATAGGGIFEFDIHERQHGVNGIVAGMPGSGKTEMVQSWLLSLAVNFSPQDVSFVLIDFKGTGMIAPFRNLPHLAGSISNLDTNIDRNLTAIQSEVHRREAIIDKYSSKSIKNVNDLNKSFAQGVVPEKLPILLIVIDEFAEFKKNFPDFGAEIDSLTSKGRALGIFVILMTQKPAGVVSSKSEDNIKFRWCLRVANYSASREMLGKPDAAKIRSPGRAFIKVGEDDVYEEVQSFWSGAPYDPTKVNQDASFIPISRVELNGKRIPCEHVEKNRCEANHEAEIDVVVKAIVDYCKTHGVLEAEKVWTDRLPERLTLTNLMSVRFDGKWWPDTKKTVPVIGLIDEPANQRQYPLEMDFVQRGHTVIYGAPVTGKTTLLQTLVMSIAMTRKPDEVSIYIMDFGGWNMNVLRDLPHVGGIANDNEPERLKKLVLLLSDTLQERKEKFSRAAVGNISAYRNSTGEKIPDVFLIVDNFGAMIKMYQDLDTFFIKLTSTGANYGIYLVTTATATNAVPMKISQNIKNVLALQMIDKSDYTYTVGKVSSELPTIMGRGYAKGNPPLEFQTALPAPGADDKDVSENIRKITAIMQNAWDGELPDIIPEMPEKIPYGSIKTNGIALGLSADKVQPVVYDYTKQHYLLISGIDQSGKSNLLQVVAKQMKEKLGGKLYVFNIKGEGLGEIRNVVDEWLVSAAEIDSFVESLRPELQSRHKEKQADPSAIFEPLILAVDDFTLFFKAISNDTADRLRAIVKIGKGLGLYLIVASDAFELSGFFTKGEATTLALGKAKQAVMLGGCMNDHGAIPTKASYNQKSVPVREHEGMTVTDGNAMVFRAMDIRGGDA